MKKGFTIIELVGVIAILGLIVVFSVPALTKTIKNSSDKEYEEFTKNITLAAENYFHSEMTEKVDPKIFIKVSKLVENGYLKKTTNPHTNELVDDNSTVIISKDINGVERYEFVDADVTETGYVTDGLVLLYDGYRQIDINTSQAIDLSGKGHNGTLTSVNNVWQKYYYKLNNKTITSSNVGTVGTIEICSDYTSDSTILTTNLGSITQSNKVCQSQNITGSISSITIGSSSLNGNIYSVRIYNKALTEEEKKQNHIVDKYRFNLGE